MVRVLLTAAAISFVVGLFPTFAQAAVDCTAWCRANRCQPGNAPSNCMERCVDARQAKHKSKK